MKVAASARKHGEVDDDIHHGVAQALRSYPQGDRLLIIGPARDGRLLEIFILDPDDEPVVIHAMNLRPKFYELLR